MTNPEVPAEGTSSSSSHVISSRFRVLLVEDNDLDAKLARRAFDRLGLAIDVDRVSDGKECLNFLRREGSFAEAVRPDVVLLDLNMPIMNGHEVLEALRSDDAIRDIPVIILSTSSDPRDIAKSYHLGCNAYMVKPTGFDDFQNLLRAFYDYWYGTTHLPKVSRL